jgi:hypothetical protein
MKWIYRNWIILIFNAFLPWSGLAQEPMYENFKTDEGLSSLQVYDIYQDAKGYMWFATDRGICRFNGYEFDVFYTNDGLTCNTVFKFFPQKNGEIWCTTFNNTLFYFNTIDYQFIPYKNNHYLKKIGPQNTPPEDLLILKNKKILISYSSRLGFISIDSASDIQDTVFVRNVIDSLAVQQIEQINGHYFGYLNAYTKNPVNQVRGGTLISWQQQLKQSCAYLHTKQINGHSIFSNQNQVYLKKKDELIKIINNNLKVLNIGSYRADEFWVSYEYGGFVIYDMEGNILRSYLKEVSGSFMYEDSERGLWFSTISKGVFYSKAQEIIELNQFTNEHIHKLAVDSQDQLWVSIYNRGVCHLNNDKVSYEFTPKGLIVPSSYYDVEMNASWSSVSSINFYGKCFSIKQLRFNTDLQRHFSEMSSVIDSNIFKFKVNSIAKNEEYFVLATTDGIYKIGPDSNLIKHANRKLDIRVEDIECIGNDIFYGAFESGLFIESKDSIVHFGVNEGLESNIVNELFVKNDSTVLVCSSKGVNKLRLRKEGWIIDPDVIMNGYDVTDVELIKDTLWVATRSGLFKILKKTVDKQYEDSHYLRFTAFQVNNENIPVSKLSELKYDQNKLSVSYLAISFKNHNDLLYRFKLKNLEDDWNYTKYRSLNYPAIPPGSYTLIVQVSVDGKNWGEEVSSDIFIAPPFYLANWFIAIICLVIILLIYAILKLKILSYNKNVLDELFRLLIRKLKRKEKHLVIRELGKDVKINSHDILYIKSAGNYCEIHTVNKKHVVRFKIGDFFELVPDKMEYIRIHRSYIVRIDQIMTKSKDSVIIGNIELKVSKSYLKELKKVQF